MSEISDCAEEEEQALLDNLTTAVFSKWSSDILLRTFKTRYEELTRLSIDFFNICFRGIKPNQMSIYLSNEQMKQSLLGYDNWSQFIPTGNVGLHHKFKTNAGVLSHILKQINLYKSNREVKMRLDEQIVSTTEYSDLEHMLEYGMFFSCFFLTQQFLFFFFVFFLRNR